jgi:oxygen-independent coproporphyrinogen III oxidase
MSIFPQGFLMAGLYIHIPFCKQACHYCDFHFSTSNDRMEELVAALCKEILLQKSYLDNESLDTIYFGGGTPSLLSKGQIHKLLEAIHNNFIVNNSSEITLEANPDDLSKENLIILRDSGVNRLSIGIQSFIDPILKFLNRPHTSEDALQGLKLARSAGFENISIDLIYAIPGQDDGQFRKNIEEALAFSPEHISAYALTIEEKTFFGHQLKKGLFPGQTEDFVATQMELLMNELGKAGFDQYEISNFSKPGFYSRHNSGYWQQKKYLGIGPSAHSYNGLSRQANFRNNNLYIQSIEHGKVPCEVEILSRSNKINEYLLTTLRTSSGSDLNYLLYQLDYDLTKQNKQSMETLLNHQLITFDENIVKLTQKGKLLADKIASDLFIKE